MRDEIVRAPFYMPNNSPKERGVLNGRRERSLDELKNHMSYRNCINALEPDWQVRALELIERRADFVVLNYTPELRSRCLTLCPRNLYAFIEGPHGHVGGFKVLNQGLRHSATRNTKGNPWKN